MTVRILAFATLVCALVSPVFAAPTFTAVPGGVQAGNWLWTVDITPDLTLIPDNSGTPVAVEFGFRLTGAHLLSATIADATQFDTANPGPKIFGWEPNDPFTNSSNSFGLQTNLVTSEIFAAYGSINFTTPGAKHFLNILASGPATGPASSSSTLQWLGAYSGSGKIVQVTGQSGPVYQTGDFFFSGSATQSVPEPASVAIAAIGVALASCVRRRSARLKRA